MVGDPVSLFDKCKYNTFLLGWRERGGGEVVVALVPSRTSQQISTAKLLIVF